MGRVGVLCAQQTPARSVLHWEEHDVHDGDPNSPLEMIFSWFLSQSASFSFLPSWSLKDGPPSPVTPGASFLLHVASLRLFGLYHRRFPTAQAKAGQAAATDHCATVTPSCSQLRPRHRQAPSPCTARSVRSLVLCPGNGKKHVHWASTTSSCLYTSHIQAYFIFSFFL